MGNSKYMVSTQLKQEVCEELVTSGLDDTTEKEFSNLKGTARSSRDRYYPPIFLEKNNNSSQLPYPVNGCW